MRSLRQRPFRRGFTLVEVLSALVIFSIAVVAILMGLSESLSIQTGLGSRQRAAMLAENILEEIRYTGDLAEGEAEGRFAGADAMFDWWTGVTASETPDLMEVSVIVSWNELGGTKEYRLQTLMKQ